ncbi:MAG TPA: hypothetical protein VJN68_01460 [Burkholderiaceae bacterium]|nr:hypothetical protein [Burkholderiaceae bacterium]
MTRSLRSLVAAMLLPLCAASTHAGGVAGLAVDNFVAIGDAVTDMLAASGLAFATMDLGSAAEPQALRASLRPTPPATAGRTQQMACSRGGHVTSTLFDMDRDDNLSSGDRFVTVFESCVTEGGVLTGRSEFRVAAHRFEGTAEVTELEFRFVGLGTPELRWSGPARAVLRSDLRRGTDRYTIRYRDLAVTRGSQAMRWNFTLDMVRPPIGAQVISVDGAITVDTLPLQLHQDEPYVLTTYGFPSSGLLTASDSHGARLQVEAGRRHYAYRLYRAGNPGELPDSASHSKPYGQR